MTTSHSNNLNVGMRCIKYMLFTINFMFVVSIVTFGGCRLWNWNCWCRENRNLYFSMIPIIQTKDLMVICNEMYIFDSFIRPPSIWNTFGNKLVNSHSVIRLGLCDRHKAHSTAVELGQQNMCIKPALIRAFNTRHILFYWNPSHYCSTVDETWK